MESVAPRQDRATTPVGVPLGEVLRIAAEYERAGRHDEAERLIGYMLAADPQQPDALHLGGIVAYRRGRYADSLERLEAAIRHGLDTPVYLRNICEIYRTLGRLDDALLAALRAAQLAPADPLCLHNLAVIHYERLEPEACERAARAALALDPTLPGPHFALAESLLLRGGFADGWEEYEWRFRIAGAAPPLPPSDTPQWDGAPMAGRLLLVADQGFGDVIQFMRYIPWAAARCPDLAIAASQEVQPLLRQVAPGALLFHRWADCPPHDAHCTLSGLPRLHGTRLESIPWDGPYLAADPARAAAWRARLAALLPPGYRRVGVAWAGRATHSNDRNRSAELPAMRALGTLPRLALVSIQKGPAAAQTGDWFGRAPLVALGGEIGDYDDTMAILAALDLLITVDTSVGHLAGAMGRPVWLLLPRAPDWRWLLDRSDSPWYPAHRLFRQTDARSWAEVLDRVVAALAG